MKEQVCIVDCCSLLQAFHIELGACRLADWLGHAFEVVVPPAIVAEMTRVLPRAQSEWRERGLVIEQLSEIRRIHAMFLVNKVFNEDFSAEIQFLEPEDIAQLDSGEIDCIALVKRISDDRCSYSLFLTDDYEACERAGKTFDKYQCGTPLQTADIIVFFGIRLKLPKAEIHQCLRSLIAFYNLRLASAVDECRSKVSEPARTTLVSMLSRGDYDQAGVVLPRLTLEASLRADLSTLIESLKSAVAEKSTLGQALRRLRGIDSLKIL